MRRPGKGAKGSELLRYAKSLGWQHIGNSGRHEIVEKDGRRVPIVTHTAQPVALGTLFEILRKLEGGKGRGGS